MSAAQDPRQAQSSSPAVAEATMPAGPSTTEIRELAAHGLYNGVNEKDACGVGFVAHIKGQKSHDIVQQGLKILENLDHRGAVGADTLMGDGAGILIQIPDAFYRDEMARQGVTLPPPGEYGVGMIFLPKEHASRLACEQELERAIKAEGQVLLGWRDVPVDRDMPMSPTVREKAAADPPDLHRPRPGHHRPRRARAEAVRDPQDRQPAPSRRSSSSTARNTSCPRCRRARSSTRACCWPTRSASTTRTSPDPRVVGAMALVHQRFSTNTFPEWPLAHPYRMLAHNGEINTVKGNVNWMRAREGVMKSPVLGDDLKKLYPISFERQSDTATFDNCLELLTMAGYPLAHAAMMMIPEAWEQHEWMDERRRAFYEYHAAMMEPWDGPAAIAFTDGRQIGATLDRNGLRPARYRVTDDDLVVLASEAGVLPIPESRIVQKWRLQPGKMFLIDLEQGRIIDDEELKDNQYANAKPYKSGSKTCASSSTRSPRRRWSRPSSLPRCWTASRPSASRRKTSSSCWRRWPPTARKASARWATTPRWPCCPTRTSRSTTTSSSCSRRSPTRRSTRSARRW